MYLHQADLKRLPSGALPHTIRTTNRNPRAASLGADVRAEIETIFEEVRTEVAPTAPSRLRALFLTTIDRTGLSVIDETAQGAGFPRLCRARPGADAATITVWIGWFQECVRRFKRDDHGPAFSAREVREHAHQYWLGQVFHAWKDATEVLVEGAVELVEWVERDDVLGRPTGKP